MPRVAFITGSSGGVGTAAVATFKDAGWYVVGFDRQPPSDVRPDRYIRVDFADAGEIGHAIAAVDDVAEVHALVNNAAISLDKSLFEITLDEWEQIMAVNVRSAFLMIQALVPKLSQRNGAVVNVSSVHAVATSVKVSAYAASKGALLALTRAAALELAEHDIRVNAILPGAVDTEMLRAGIRRRYPAGEEEQGLRELADRTPLRAIGTPEQIARSILFLADFERSGFITGQALVVDGGATARLSTE